MTTRTVPPGAEQLSERLSGAMLATLEVACVHLGDRLGLYRALADGGAQTSADLAARANVDERYAREWLEQQAVSGIVAVDDPSPDAARRRYALPEAHREPLLDPDSPLQAAAMATIAVGALAPIEALVAAFRTGEGVAYADYGADMRAGIAGVNRPMFVNQLAQDGLPAVPGLDARLRRPPAARVADIACGGGWSSVAIARACPALRVDGFDVDHQSIRAARDLVEEEGLGDRVRFHVQDASDPGIAGSYDLVTIFEALHDMARPVDALRTARGLLADGGCVLVGDEKVAERFIASGDELERLNDAFSVLHCLAVGREDAHSAATGTVMRPDTMDGYARAAGFAGGAEVLPIAHDFWRFYLLTG